MLRPAGKQCCAGHWLDHWNKVNCDPVVSPELPAHFNGKLLRTPRPILWRATNMNIARTVTWIS